MTLSKHALYAVFAIWLVSLGFRGIYITQLNPEPELTGDGFYYHTLANNLAEGHGFRMLSLDLFDTEEVADHPPGYPVLLGAASSIGLDSRNEHRMVSALVASLAVPLLGLAAARLAGRRRRRRGPPPPARLVAWAGIAAAALAALNANMWIYDPLILAEPLVLAATAAWLYACLVYDDRPSVGAAVAIGLSLGVAAATRSELLAAGGVIVVLLWRHRSYPWQRMVLHGGAMVLAVAVLIGPWVWTNQRRFAEPVAMTTGLGTTMVQANCDLGFYGPITGYSDFSCFDRTRSVTRPGMDPSERDLLNREISTNYIKANAARVPVVLAARIGRTFGFFRPTQQVFFMESVELRGPHWAAWAGIVSWQLLLPLGLAGVVLARRERRLISPVVFVAGSIVLAVALTQGADRYRLALECILVAYAGYGVALGLNVLGRSKPALAPTGLGRWLRKWAPTPEPKLPDSAAEQPPSSTTGASHRSGTRV